MEKRNKIALKNLIKELENLSSKEDLDNLGNNIVEPHQVKTILESFKICLSDQDFEELKREVIEAAEPEEEPEVPEKKGGKDFLKMEDEEEGNENEQEEEKVKEAVNEGPKELENNIDLKKFLEVVKEKMDLLVTEHETKLALRTLTQFKKDSISLVELR